MASKNGRIYRQISGGKIPFDTGRVPNTKPEKKIEPDLLKAVGGRDIAGRVAAKWDGSSCPAEAKNQRFYMY